jgi:hypothetical protein
VYRVCTSIATLLRLIPYFALSIPNLYVLRWVHLPRVCYTTLLRLIPYFALSIPNLYVLRWVHLPRLCYIKPPALTRRSAASINDIGAEKLGLRDSARQA